MNVFQKLGIAALSAAVLAGSAVAGGKNYGAPAPYYGGKIEAVTQNAITLQTPENTRVSMAYTPFTKVKIKEYSFYGKRKYRGSVADLKAGDFVQKVKAAPAVDGTLMAYKIEVVR